MEETVSIKISKWDELKSFFFERLKSPIDHPEYIFYFLGAVIGAGGIGIWASVFGETNSQINKDFVIAQSISAFSVAVIATGSIELFFVKNKYIKITLFIISAILISLSIVSYLICNTIGDANAYYLAIPMSVLALLVWWIANAENANLTENFFIEQSKVSKEFSKTLDDYDV